MNAPFLRPFGCPHGVDPRRWRVAIRGRLNRLLDAADRLVAVLDAMDGDAEAEDEIEMDVSWPERGPHVLAGDRQHEDAEEGDDPAEPSLGWTEQFSQARIALDHSHNDKERDDADTEPSLGAPEREHRSQIAWAAGSDSDMEKVRR